MPVPVKNYEHEVYCSISRSDHGKFTISNKLNITIGFCERWFGQNRGYKDV